MRKIIRFHIALLACVFVFQKAHTQSQIDQELAKSYMAQGEYEKALIYYQDFYDSNPQLAFAIPLFTCYSQTGEYKTAEKLMRKEMRKHPENLILGIKLGQMFKQSGDLKRAEKEWDAVILRIPKNQNDVIRIARKFAAIPEYAYALKVYEKGKRDLNGFYAFNFEIADLYGQMGQRDKMIDMYLEMLGYNSGYMQTVQNLLARNIDFEDDVASMELLRTRLLRFIQQQPDEPLYAELLIWLYIQQQDFIGAFTQVKALDRRLNEDGYRIMGLAEIAESNEEYDVSSKAYLTVVKKGETSPYFLEAQKSGLRTKKLALEKNANATSEEYLALSSEYEAFIDEISFPQVTASSQRELASLLARKLKNQDSALVLLKELIAIPSLSKEFKAECQIDAGDFMVMNNQVWDAALEYLKAEKAFKYDEIGERAKFKAAKIYYYNGEFGFAKGMLDVLKGSTSRLIANDALYLSQLILDNTTIDTSEAAMQLFARADLYFNQQRYQDSNELLDSLLNTYPGHRLIDDVYFMKYNVFMELRDHQRASEALIKIATEFKDDILGDDAVYLLGVLNEEQFNNKEVAMNYYESILTDFPASLFVVDARKRFRLLRGDNLQ